MVGAPKRSPSGERGASARRDRSAAGSELQDIVVAEGHHARGRDRRARRRELLAAAEAELRAALDVNIALAGADSWRAARSEASLGWALIARDEAAEGEPMLLAARAKLLTTVGPRHPATQQATARLVKYYRAHHRDAEAARVLAAPNTG